MTQVIPEVKPMKGKEIPEATCGYQKKLTPQEKDKVEIALDNIVAAYYSVWFGYPIRDPKNLRKDLRKAKQLLAQVKCPEVI